MLALDAETCARTAHEDVKHFVKGTGVINRNKTAIETCHGVTFQCRPSGHQGPHGGHHLQVQDGFLDFILGVVRELLVEVIHVALYGFMPMFTTILGINPARITALVYVLLEGGWELGGMGCRHFFVLAFIPVLRNYQVFLEHQNPW